MRRDPRAEPSSTTLSMAELKSRDKLARQVAQKKAIVLLPVRRPEVGKRILDATAELLDEHGFLVVTVDGGTKDVLREAWKSTAAARLKAAKDDALRPTVLIVKDAHLLPAGQLELLAQAGDLSVVATPLATGLVQQRAAWHRRLQLASIVVVPIVLPLAVGFLVWSEVERSASKISGSRPPDRTASVQAPPADAAPMDKAASRTTPVEETPASTTAPLGKDATASATPVSEAAPSPMPVDETPPSTTAPSNEDATANAAPVSEATPSDETPASITKTPEEAATENTAFANEAMPGRATAADETPASTAVPAEAAAAATEAPSSAKPPSEPTLSSAAPVDQAAASPTAAAPAAEPSAETAPMASSESAQPLPKPEAPRPAGAPGLLLRAKPGDTLEALYLRVYRGTTPPPFALVAALNPKPIRAGVIVTFPEPQDAWRRPDDKEADTGSR